MAKMAFVETSIKKVQFFLKNIFTSKSLIIRDERKKLKIFQEKTFKNIWWVIKNAITLHSLLRNKAHEH